MSCASAAWMATTVPKHLRTQSAVSSWRYMLAARFTVPSSRIDEKSACGRDHAQRVQLREVRPCRFEATNDLRACVDAEDLESVVVESPL